MTLHGIRLATTALCGAMLLAGCKGKEEPPASDAEKAMGQATTQAEKMTEEAQKTGEEAQKALGDLADN